MIANHVDGGKHGIQGVARGLTVEANFHFLAGSAPTTTRQTYPNVPARSKKESHQTVSPSHDAAPRLRQAGSTPTRPAATWRRAQAEKQQVGPNTQFLGKNNKYATRQVPLYCFRRSKCGTFMPLSCVRGESRIAVVWTLFVAAVSASSSVHFRNSVHTSGRAVRKRLLSVKKNPCGRAFPRLRIGR
jgi:hypothetical protein